jgi:hypothetical protein
MVLLHKQYDKVKRDPYTLKKVWDERRFAGEFVKEYFERGHLVNEIFRSFAVLYANPKTWRKAEMVREVINDWLDNYHCAQLESRGKLAYLVMGNEDRAVPFREEHVYPYTEVLTEVARLAVCAAKVMTNEEFSVMASTFKLSSSWAGEIFRKCPTITLRPQADEYKSGALRAVQMLDDATNCCPSIHIAYSLLIYNIWAMYWDRINDKGLVLYNSAEEANEKILGIINSVLYTKQHTHIDVSMGMLLANRAFDEHYLGTPFHDLTWTMRMAQYGHRHIDYERIIQDYCAGANAMHGGPRREEKRREYVNYVIGQITKKKNYPLVDY